MTKSVEFSNFYRLLISLKEGDESKLKELGELLNAYQSRKGCTSALDELGKLYCWIGLKELYNYSGSTDLQLISNMEKSDWDALKQEKGIGLPEFLSSGMIKYVKENDLIKIIAENWNLRPRKFQKDVVGMSRYITEGFLELIS